jgi:hypothetical protein
MAITLSGDAATTRASLGLGSAATLDAGTGANQILQLDGSGNLPAVDGSALTGIDTLPTQTGNAGKALITDGSSASWGTAGSMVKLAGAKLDGTQIAAIDIEVFSADYTHYVLILDGLATANAGNIIPFLRYRNASGEVSSSFYHWQTSHPHSSSGGGGQHNSHGGWNDSTIRIHGSNGIKGGSGTSSNEGLNAVIHIYNPYETDRRTHVTFESSGFEQNQTQFNTHLGSGMYQNTERFVGVRIQYSGDNICYGSWAMYGVAR